WPEPEVGQRPPQTGLRFEASTGAKKIRQDGEDGGEPRPVLCHALPERLPHSTDLSLLLFSLRTSLLHPSSIRRQRLRAVGNTAWLGDLEPIRPLWKQSC